MQKTHFTIFTGFGVNDVLEARIIFGKFVLEMLALIEFNPTSIVDPQVLSYHMNHRRDGRVPTPNQQTTSKCDIQKRGDFSGYPYRVPPFLKTCTTPNICYPSCTKHSTR